MKRKIDSYSFVDGFVKGALMIMLGIISGVLSLKFITSENMITKIILIALLIIFVGLAILILVKFYKNYINILRERKLK